MTENNILPLFKNLYANTYIKAFMLNAFIFAIISALSIEFRLYLESLNSKYIDNKFYNDLTKMIVVFIWGLFVGTIIYLFMYLMFGFGGGMITNDNKFHTLIHKINK